MPGLRRGTAAVVLAMLLAACSTGAVEEEPEAAPASGAVEDDRAGHGHGAAPAAAKRTPLRRGERIVDLAMPADYEPTAQAPGTDDYRCFLLDPGLTEDAFVTGVDVAPGDADVVHHVILFKVPPESLDRAHEVDEATPGQGWTCFGGSGLDAAGASLDNAPWLGAWAPGGGETVLDEDIGIPLDAGSAVVMQVHYNLLAGSEPDRSSARLRLAPASQGLDALETTLLPAPVELPCREGATGRLCDRETAVLDVMNRFGPTSGQVIAGLQLFCGQGAPVPPGPRQSCTRPVTEPATIRAAAGHMHLLGRSIKIEVNPGRGGARTVLDIPVWDFDDQSTRSLSRPVRIRPGDELRVTCRHDQGLRDQLPAFDGQPERYVVWGEGTTDEMCLGIVLVTRP